MEGPRPGNHEYTVGWICALAVELAAARAMLDVSYGKPEQQDAQDRNVYHLGSVGGHKVAIACLPAGVYGTTSAATVATQMLYTFRSIRFGLMVGIGGAIPSPERDIRLGDVVVSKPEGDVSGVVQYDLGSAVAGGRFKRVGCLNKPPSVLLNAVQSLQAEHMLEESKVAGFISDMLAQHSKAKFKAEFGYQGAEKDVLYKAEYDHDNKRGNSCDACDPSKVVSREDRDDIDPVIHYGIIASGNQVMKDSKARDRIGQDTGAICFEMEAAGLMDNFPCLVVRGICDYSDSHKNKQWQPYAAVTAAAYTKELLQEITPHQVEIMQMVTDGIKNGVQQIRDEVKNISKRINFSQEERERKEILQWLTKVDYGLRHSYHCSVRREGTGIWFIESPEFTAWKNGKKDTLCCPGIPGAGKSVITSIAIEHLRNTFPVRDIGDHKTGIVFIYFSYMNKAEQGIEEVVSTLIKQLVQQMPSLPDCIKSLHAKYEQLSNQPPLLELRETLNLTVQWFTSVYVMVDALDESTDICRKKLLFEIRELQKQYGLKLMVTTRIIPAILDDFDDAVSRRIEASQGDVGCYLDVEMPLRLPQFVRDNGSLMQSIRRTILEAVCGMFLLARLHLNSLADKISEKEIECALGELPHGERGLSDAYGNAMERIGAQAAGHRKLAIRVLSWIANAQRILTIKELQTALAVEKGSDELDRKNMPDIKILVSVCGGLVMFQQASNTVELVHLTTKEYFDGVGRMWVVNGSRDMALTCLTYLSHKTFSSGFCSTERKLQIRIAKNELFDYAARYWAHHARDVQVEIKDVALPFLRDRNLASACFQVISPKSSDSVRSVISKHSTDSERLKRIKNTTDFPWYDESIGVTGLDISIYYDLEHLFRCLVTQEESVDPIDIPLIWAANSGRLGFLEVLLGHGADVNSEDKRGWNALYYAAWGGYADCVKFLLENGARVGASTRRTRSTLSMAVERGHFEVAQMLLENGAEATEFNFHDYYNGCYDNTFYRCGQYNNGRYNDGYYGYNDCSSLHFAINMEDLALIDLLLKNGADIHETNIYGCTPLFSAARYNRQQIVQFLLERGAGAAVHLQSSLGIALKLGHLEITEMLIDEGADLNDSDLMHSLIMSGDEDKVQFLLGRGASVDALGGITFARGLDQDALVIIPRSEESYFGFEDSWSADTVGTALWLASFRAKLDMMRMLLENGADMEIEDSRWKITALGAAAVGRKEEAVRLLLERGARVQGGLALLHAAYKSSLTIAQLLLRHGADTELKDGEGRKAIHYAACGANMEVAQLLIKSRADVRAADQKGDTALHHLAQHCRDVWMESKPEDYLPMMNMLLDHAPDLVDARNREGETALHILANSAICINRVVPWAAVRLLLGRNADINAKQSDGQTPLHVAVRMDWTELAAKLVKEGGDVNVDATDANGRTPLYYARRRCCIDVVEVLLANGAKLEGDVAMCQVAEHTHHAEVQQWLSDGGNVHALDDDGETALHQAAKHGYARAVRLLLEHGAEIERECRSQHFQGLPVWRHVDAPFARETALDYAARGGHEAAVRVLLEHGASVPYQTVWAAARVGYEQVVLLLLASDPPASDASASDLSASGSDSDSWVSDSSSLSASYAALCAAAESGSERLMRLLLPYQALNTDYLPALDSAAARGHEGVVRLLLGHGVDFDQDNGSALYAAVKAGHLGTVRLLLQHGAPTHADALELAVTSGNVDLTTALLDTTLVTDYDDSCYDLVTDYDDSCYDFDSGFCPTKSSTLLHRAVQEGYDQILGLLLDRGADICARDGHGRAPLHKAIHPSSRSHHRQPSEARIRLLLKHSAPVHSSDNDGLTPLHLSAADGYETAAQLLLDHGASVHIADESGKQALHHAASGGSEPLVQLLLRRGADPWATDGFGATPLHAAAEAGHAALIHLLLAQVRMPVDIKTNAGETALHLAAGAGQYSILKELLAIGAVASARDYLGRTCLHHATAGEQKRYLYPLPLQVFEGRHRWVDVVKLLLAQGVAPSIIDRNGDTAADLASDWMQTIIACGADAKFTKRSVAISDTSSDLEMASSWPECF